MVHVMMASLGRAHGHGATRWLFAGFKGGWARLLPHACRTSA